MLYIQIVLSLLLAAWLFVAARSGSGPDRAEENSSGLRPGEGHRTITGR